MSGLEKIISQIEEEAGHSAEEIIREAREQAEAILGAADEECEKIRHRRSRRQKPAGKTF